MKNIEKILPYMESEDLYELGKDIVNGEIDADLTALFPYMDDDDLSRLISDVVKRGIKIDFAAAAPYLDEEDVYKLVKMALERDIEINVKELLPYMDEEDVDKICKQLADNPELDLGLTVDDLYPYASEEGIDSIFLRNAQQGIFEESALPYVSEECLHDFVVSYCDNPNFEIDIDVLYPYLSSKDITLILRSYLKKRKQ